MIEDGSSFRCFASRICNQHPAGHIFQTADPEFRVRKLPAEPPCIADMIRVHMRDNYAPNWASVQLLLEDLSPCRFGIVHRHARIDNGPAFFAIIDEPKIDPLQRERQRHADPVNARRHFYCIANFRRRFAKRIFERRAPSRLASKSIHE